MKNIKRTLELHLPNEIKINGNDCKLHINVGMKDVIKISYMHHIKDKFDLSSKSQIHLYYKLLKNKTSKTYNNNDIIYLETWDEIIDNVMNKIS